MQSRALLIYGDDIDLFSSPQALSCYLEYDSYSGDEVAFLENGENLDLIVKYGLTYRNLFGITKYIYDFKYVEAVPTGDLSSKDVLGDHLISFLKKRHNLDRLDYQLEELMSFLLGVIKEKG